MKYSQEIRETLETLKDFQQATVNHVVECYLGGQKKYLIADEVGLGKTIVAKGIIAKLYEKEYNANKNFNIIYICSNLALAKQNLSKLNPFKQVPDHLIIDYSQEDDRLTSLAYEPQGNDNEYKLKIRAFTPATSFNNRSKPGKADERVLLYRLLSTHPEMKSRKTALKWFLRGNRQISVNNWCRKIEEIGGMRPIRPDIYGKFHQRIENSTFKQSPVAFGEDKSILDTLQHILEERKQNRTFENGKDYDYFQRYYPLISELRLQLSHICQKYLQADLFILDEFQRFSQLIKPDETENEGEEIARAIFSQEDARVLLLSATPFKAFTNSFDEMQGEHHYSEFKTVLQFLKIGEDVTFWETLDKENHCFFSGLKAFESVNYREIISHKQYIENVYRKCIARTERVIVEGDGTESPIEPFKKLEINPQDIEDYIAIDRIIMTNNEESGKKLPEVVEYVKSTPFPLSFLQDYDHHKVLQENYNKSSVLQDVIKSSSKAFLPVGRISEYEALLPESSVSEPNPKLRLLYNETIRNNGYKLLWIPPSVNYYNARSGVYHNVETFSKTLIFSSWKMVPRMVSALVSYEAERLTIGKYYKEDKTNKKYFVNEKEKRHPVPILTFKYTENKGVSSMNNFMLIYPSAYLSAIYNPVRNVVEGKKLSEIRSALTSKIKRQLKELGAFKMGHTDGDWQKWYWYAVLLLDKNTANNQGLIKWLQANHEIIDEESDNETEVKDNNTAREKHLEQVRTVILNDTIPSIGKLAPHINKITDFLCELCLGAPGIVAWRSLQSIYSNTLSEDLYGNAAKIANGFISLFNKPEAIAIIKSSGNDETYYQNVLKYCVNGNIQSMLDEYMYQLHDSGGYKSAFEAAELIHDILKINTGSVDIITPESLENKERKSLRTHYAVSFGTEKGSSLKSGKRQIKVRETFNSPFRPFVLTSTSIGQEGLDFHFYCSKIIHWNLPGNPIDLEQREGRIKRYKSLLIRRNVGRKYKSHLQPTDLENNLWHRIFDYAQMEKQNCDNPCDLIPYWHINGGENARIKSLIPIYPFSKDSSKYRYIKNVLANYRLTFGQPRQEELVLALQHLKPEERKEIKKLLLNLSPILYKI